MFVRTARSILPLRIAIQKNEATTTKALSAHHLGVTSDGILRRHFTRCKAYKADARSDYRSQPNGDFMRQTVIAILGALLIAGPAAQIATASEHHNQNARRAPSAIGELVRNANDSIARRANGFCSQEPGNPYNEQTDYLAWSAFRESGAWDSRYDCQ